MTDKILSGPASGAALPLGRTAKSLPELVADRLLEEIMTGRLAPGDRLKEIALAQEHAVSRATIREALTTLERRGFVERIPRIGARVTAVGKGEVYDLFDIRGVLFGLAARRVVENAPDATLDEFEALVSKIEALAERRSTPPHSFGEHSIGAQHFLLRASGSRWLSELYEQLSKLSTWRLIRAKAISFGTAERRLESARDWRRIADAIRGRDADRAESAARMLLAHSARGVRAQLEQALTEASPDGHEPAEIG